MKPIIFNYKSTAGVRRPQLEIIIKRLKPYLILMKNTALRNDYEQPESVINIPFDGRISRRVLAIFRQKATKRLRQVIVIGIGGSSLGAQAVYDALNRGGKQIPQLLFLDTNDPTEINRALSLVKNKGKHPEEILILIITKSGSTVETIMNAELVLKVFVKPNPKNKERVIVITDPNSILWEEARKQKMACLPHEPVGGRYAVFSTVGLLPLKMAGFNIKDFLAGARLTRKQCLKTGLNNPAALSAAILYIYACLGKRINDNFFFHPELESVGKWYQQLMAESLGKKRNLSKKVVHAGITPQVSIGSSDLHSLAQLYLGGPRDKVTTFVMSASFPKTIKVTSSRYFKKAVPSIIGKDAGEVMRAIYKGTLAVYQKEKLPFVEIILPDISEAALGQYMQFKITEILLLARLMRVNPFSQPQVELYKKETKKNLKR